MSDKLVTPTPESKAFADAFESHNFPPQWADLNDVFAAGKLEVWYMRPDCFRDYGSFSDKRADPKNMEATHILLGSIAPSPSGEYSVDDLDGVWVKLQGEFWSPNGEGRDLIRGKGLRHTSMSVGDCFRLNGEVWRCDSIGFVKLGTEDFDSRTFKKVK